MKYDWDNTRNRKARTLTARELRKSMTPEETILWRALRNRKFRGTKIRRQVPIGPFIVDFLCMPLRLVIELEGGIHNEQKEHDQERADYLMERGYKVLRISNEEVNSNLPSVLRRIEASIYKE